MCLSCISYSVLILHLHRDERSQRKLDPKLCFYTQRGLKWWKKLTFQHKKNLLYSVVLNETFALSYHISFQISNSGTRNYVKARSGLHQAAMACKNGCKQCVSQCVSQTQAVNCGGCVLDESACEEVDDGAGLFSRSNSMYL